MTVLAISFLVIIAAYPPFRVDRQEKKRLFPLKKSRRNKKVAVQGAIILLLLNGALLSVPKGAWPAFGIVAFLLAVAFSTASEKTSEKTSSQKDLLLSAGLAFLAMFVAVGVVSLFTP